MLSQISLLNRMSFQRGDFREEFQTVFSSYRQCGLIFHFQWLVLWLDFYLAFMVRSMSQIFISCHFGGDQPQECWNQIFWLKLYSVNIMAY